jgi:glycosyltransferase involved in cell wall biosynthesis
MHVLITADTVGGVWTYTRELVTGLAARGIRVTLVSFGRIPTPAQSAWLEGLTSVEYLPTGFRLEWMQEADGDVADSIRYLQGIVRERKPDLLHLSQFCYGALDAKLPKIVVAHSDVISWNRAVHGAQPAGRWAEWYCGVVSEGLAGASLVVAPSHWMLGQVESCYGIKLRSRVIYNGRTPEQFNRLCRKREYAASAGRLWDEGKQSRLLMELGHPPLPILVAGALALEDEGEPELPEHAFPEHGPSSDDEQERCGPPYRPAVHCRGVLSEAGMRELLARAAIYIATSKYEPFGLAPLEAALSGCALVANDIPSLREVWGAAALYFRKDDTSSLAELLALLHGNRELCLDYADRAYAHACRNYSAARMVDEYVEAYRALLGQGVAAA